MRLQSTASVGTTNGVKIIVYGKAGMGKTTLISTCPNPVIFSAESGLLSLKRFQLPYYEIKNLQDLRDAYRWASSSAEARQFQTLCIDSISEIAEVVLVDSKAAVKDGRLAYGKMIDDMHVIIKQFRDLPRFHVYMSAKQEYMKTDTGAIINGPMMPGNKLGQAMPYFPDELFQLTTGTAPDGTEYRYLRTQPDFSNDAKDRSGVLNPIEEPNLGKIIAKIMSA